MPKTDAYDPTKAVLGSTGLYKKSLCDYVVNVATGCHHACRFCYVPATPNIKTRGDMLADVMDVEEPQREWGEYVAYRDDLPPRLAGILERKRKWTTSDRGQGVVGISYSTDCFMDRRAGAITAGAVRALADHNRYARVQTRNPYLAATGRPPETVRIDDESVSYPDGIPLADRDEPYRSAFHDPDSGFMDAFQAAGDHVTVGSSINSLNPGHVLALEPNTPPDRRIQGLREFRDAGVSVFVSMSPTYPTMSRADIRELMAELADLQPDVVFHEPINPRGINMDMTVTAAREAGQTGLADALRGITDTEAWVDYSLRHLRWVQEHAADMDLPVHLWPDSDLLTQTSGGVLEWLQAWRTRGSPESFADRPDPGPMPEIPPEVPGGGSA